MKKFISTIIALAMVVTMLPMTMASAAGELTLVSNGSQVTIVGETDDTVDIIKRVADGSKTQTVDWINLSAATSYIEIDMGQVHDIRAVKFYGRNYGEANTGRKVWLSETKLDAAPTADTATLALEVTDGNRNGEITLENTVSGRYMYVTATSQIGCNEVEAYIDATTDAIDLAYGKTAVDNYGNETARFTNGVNTSAEYYNVYGENMNENDGIQSGEWFRIDLGSIAELKHVWISKALDGTYQQSGLEIKASTTENFENAVTIVSAVDERDGGLDVERNIYVEGNYRYIWLTNSGNGYGAYIADLKVYGYPTTATTVQVDPRNYTNTINWYSDSACTTAAEGSAWTNLNAWELPEGIHNFTQAQFTDGDVSTDGILAISAYTEAGTPTLEVNVPRINADGWYDVSYFAGGYSQSYVKVTPIKITMKKGTGEEFLVSEHLPGARSATAEKRVKSVSNNHGVWKVSGDKVYLEKGSDYKMYITLYQANSSAAKKTQTLLSRITLTPSTAQKVTADTATVLEYEKYAAYHKETNEAASGGELIAEKTAAMGLKGNSISPYHINMPVEVEKAGIYSIKAVIGTSANNTNLSTTKVLVDGNQVISNDVAGVDSSIPSFNDEVTFDLDEYEAAVYLTEGKHTISTTVSARATNTNNVNYAGFAADCITIEKAAARTEYTIQPYAASNIATAASWFTDKARTTPATTALSSIVSAYNPPSGVIGSYSCDSFGKNGFSDNYLSVRGVYAGTTADSANEAVTFTLNDTLVIGATDYYKLSYAFGGTTGYGFSGMSVELVDVNDATKKNVITRYVPEDWSNKDQNGLGALNNQSVYTNDHNEIAKIDEGEYKVNITIHSPQDTKSGHYFSLSDINLKATDPVEVTTTAKTVLEYEDYTHYGDYQNTTEAGVANASGGKAAITYYGTPHDNGPIEINMPITVAEGTDYKIEAALARGYCGTTKVYVDGEEILYNHDLTYPMGVSLLNDNSYAMYKGSKVVNLTAGEHMITTKVTKAGSLLRMGADYISIEKYYENPISQSEATRIEAEDYADEFAAAFGETAYEDGLGNYANPTQPVGKVKFTETGKNFSGNYAMMGSKATEGEKTFSIPVNVTEEGYYNATFRVGGTESNNGFAWFDATLVAEDGTEYVLSDGIIRPVMDTGSGENVKVDKEAVETQVRINDGQGRYSWQLTGSSVKVPAGKYNLKFTLDGTTFLLDYVDINPVAAAAVGDKIEVDDVNIRRVAYDESLASGGTIQYAHWAYDKDEQIKLVYPIKIDEAGYYDVETVMFYSAGNNTSRTKVMIDDKVVYDNRNTATDLSTVNEEGNRIFVNGNFPMNKYTGGKIYLEPGVHEIVYVINATQEPAQYVYKFAYDYTKVTKSQDSIDVADDGYVTITANYTEPVTGTVYMAFYNDGALVSVEKSTNANNQTVVNGEAQGPTTDYDYVKMFVWDVENDNIAPDAFAIGFAQ